MHQDHLAGEKMFIDYAGQTIDIVDSETGEIHPAQIFVAVLGASNYTFAEATQSQQLENWIMSHVRVFAYFGGMPETEIPGNLRCGVNKTGRYEPDLNPTYHDLARHYQTVVLQSKQNEVTIVVHFAKIPKTKGVAALATVRRSMSLAFI